MKPCTYSHIYTLKPVARARQSYQSYTQSFGRMKHSFSYRVVDYLNLLDYTSVCQYFQNYQTYYKVKPCTIIPKSGKENNTLVSYNHILNCYF